MSETVDKLMDSAEHGIRLRGYHAVSFRDLADELGIKSSSVHYHFRQKEDLGLALVARYSKRVFAALESQSASARTPEEFIRALCAVYRQSLTNADETCLCGVLGAESAGLPDALSEAVAEFFKANIDWVANALADTLPEHERRARAAHIIAALQGAMMLSTSLNDHTIFDTAVEDLLARLAP
jgi:TetR/AcrR family transcriptional repressor of nem operon